MQIGGADIVIPGRATERQRKDLLLCLSGHWPDAVRVPGEEGPERELFIYENEAARVRWETEGGEEWNMATLIHVLYRQDSTTIVVDRRGSYLYEFVQTILRAVWGAS